METPARAEALRSAAVPLFLAAAITIAWSLKAHAENGFGATLVLLIAVFIAGFAAIAAMAKRLDDPNLLKVRYVLLAKIALLLVFCVMWDRTLRQERSAIEGDQERYYYEAVALGHAGLSPSALSRIVPNINYPGILYIYGAVSVICGDNVYGMALFNTVGTLATALLLIHVAYRIKPVRDRTDWIIGLMMLAPELVCSDVMTSRDTLAMSLMSIPVLLIANYLIKKDGNLWLTLLLAVPFFVLLAAVRTTALIPATATIIVLLLWFRSRVRIVALAMIAVAAIAFLFLAPRLSAFLGGYHMTYAQILAVTAINPESKFINIFAWSHRSIGRLLIPRTIPQAILFSVPRLIAYLIVPLPATRIDWSAIAAGHWLVWQDLLAASSSVIYIALFPLALIALKNAVIRRDASLVLVVPYWFTMIAIASGTAVLHDRYRVMAVPFLCGCLWLGRIASRRQLIGAYVVWTSILLAGGAAAVLYKYVLA